MQSIYEWHFKQDMFDEYMFDVYTNTKWHQQAHKHKRLKN